MEPNGDNVSGKRVSNPRPAAWEAAALPTELLPPDEDLIKSAVWWKFSAKSDNCKPFAGLTIGRHSPIARDDRSRTPTVIVRALVGSERELCLSIFDKAN